jgi:hypothetical protein
MLEIQEMSDPEKMGDLETIIRGPTLFHENHVKHGSVSI